MPRERDAVLQALELFRKMQPDIGLSPVRAFLYVCENEGLTIQELAYAMDSTEATASRCVRALARAQPEGQEVPRTGLVRSARNVSDGRSRNVVLTPAGAALRAKLDAVIRAAVPIVAAAGAEPRASADQAAR